MVPSGPASAFVTLGLLTGRLEEQRRFYVDVMGMRFLCGSSSIMTLQAGSTRLTFANSHPSPAQPFYYFSVATSPSKFPSIAERIRHVAPLLEIVSGPPCVGVCFVDPGGNLVTLVPGRTAKEADAPDRSERDLLGIQEFGLVEDDIEEVGARLSDQMGLAYYRPVLHPLNPPIALGGGGTTLALSRTSSSWPASRRAFPFPFSLSILGSGRNREQLFRLSRDWPTDPDLRSEEAVARK